MPLKRTLKYIGLIFLSALLLIALLLSYGIYNNNTDVPPTPQKEIQTSLDSAIGWLVDNEKKLFTNHNSALWWMIKEASLISNSKTLKRFYASYKYSYLDLSPNNVWTPYFDDTYTPVISDISEIDHLRDYQIFFIYSLSCSDQLASEPVIQRQLNSDFCSNHFFHPRCVTHQQMGVRFLNKKRCGDHKTLSNQLLDIMEQEITLDFRVTDSYLQRALMLTDSGRKIKPIWLSKIINAQRPDGGWADFYPLMSIGSIELGTTSTRPTKGPKQSNFHATAQAIWLLAMLIDQPTGN